MTVPLTRDYHPTVLRVMTINSRRHLQPLRASRANSTQFGGRSKRILSLVDRRTSPSLGLRRPALVRFSAVE